MAQRVAAGQITLTVVYDGDPAKTYVLLPSVESVTKKLDGTLSVTGVTCSVYKVTGSSAYALTGDHTLTYIRKPDGAAGTLAHTAGTSQSIAVLAMTESIEFELKDGSTVIDRVRIPVLSDATDVNNELDTYKYLKDALKKQGTTIQDGLILSSLIALGYTDDNNVRHTLAGTNGIYVPKLGDRTIGSWWGGDMLDLFKADDTRKTYDELKTESGKNNPLAATSLVRMDGSAYFANGNIGFKADGSGWLGNENGIKWTPLGALTIGAGVTIDVTGDDGVKRTLTDVANFITAVTSLLAPADANGKELQWNQVAQAQTIMAKKTFFSLGGVSAKGIGSSTGGGGSVFGLYTDSTWAATPSTTDALGAVLGKSLHTRISALEGKNYLDELTLAEAGTGNAVTDVSLSNDKKTLTVTYGASYLSGITKAMVEGVLTGNITTHTHSQYLTSASLSGYYSKTQADERFQPKGNYVTNVTLNDYYTKPQIYNSPIIVYISRFVTLDFDEPLLPQSLSGTPTVLYDTVSKTLVAMSGYPIRPSITNSDGIFTNWVGAEGMGSVLTATRGWTPRSDVLYYNLQASEFYRWDGTDMVAVDELNDMASGGGLDESQLADYLTTNNYAKKSDIPSLSGYATQAWVTGKGYLTSSSLHTLTIQKNGTTVGTYKPNADATINIADVASAATLENHLNNTTNHVAGAEKLLWNQTATKLNAILGEDSDTIINKWEEVVAFLDTYTEADTLANLLSNKVDKEHGKGLSSNDFTDALKLKLTGLQNYTLPTASADTLGGVKIGANITITNGVISTHAPYSLPTASASVKGGVKVGVFGGLKMSGETLVVNLSATDIPDLSWEKITSGKPTSLSGYGITDAKIENGVITLGGKTITPITSHQSIHALTIKGNGTSLLTYNPKTEAAEIDITPAKIGASPSSHVHTQYAPVTALTNIYTKTEADNKFQPKGSYLTAITKAQVEAVLTGNITSHTHAQYAPVLLLANYVERVKLDNNTDIGALTGSHLYYSDTDGNTATMKNSPFAQSFMMLTQTCYNSGDDIRRARLAVDAWGGIKVFDDRGVSGTGGTWHTVLTDKNTKITNGTITINGTSITPLVQHQSLANYVTTNTAQRISGGKTFNNGALAVRQDKACGLTFYSFGDSDTERVAAIEILGASGSWLKNSLDFYKSGRIVARNSFTATSIIKSGGTSSQFLMADGSVATKHILTSQTNLGWAGSRGQVATIDTLAFWNGQYAAGGSNLMYCDRGRFGTMATMDATDYPTVERFNSGVAFMAGKFPDVGVLFNVMHDEDKSGVGIVVNIPTKTSHLTNDSGFLTSHQSLTDYFKRGGGEVMPVAYVDLTTYTSGAANYKNYQSGTYQIARGGYSDLVVNLALNSGSTSALQFLTNYSDNANLKYRKTIDSNRVSGPWRTIVTELNVGSYALTPSNYTSTLDSRYVKKAGDTMTGALSFSLDNQLIKAIYNSTGSYSNVLWVSRSDATVIYGSPQWAKVVLETSGSCAYRQTSGVQHKIWDAGNDGSGSGLDADLLDGLHVNSHGKSNGVSRTYYFSSVNATRIWIKIGTLPLPSAVGSGQSYVDFEVTGLVNFGYNSSSTMFVHASTRGSARVEYSSLGGGTNCPVAYYKTTTDNVEIWLSCTELYSGMTAIEFKRAYSNFTPVLTSQTTDPTGLTAGVIANGNFNTASATKLQTARTIWGQSFDGSGNVSGTVYVRGGQGNYREGVRIYAANGWSDIVLGGSDLTANEGVSANTWAILNNDGNFYINKNASSGQGAPRLWGHANGWTVGNTTRTTYALNTASFICESWIRTVGNAGWYSETYGGGWYMQDSTWIRIHGGKSLYAASGIICTDGELQVGGGGDKFRVTAAGAVTATSFTKRGGTAAQSLMADGSVRRVITFDDLTDDGSFSTSDFDATLANGLVSVGALAEWDGRIKHAKANISSSTGTIETYNCNLQYCALGKFGDIVTHNASEFLTSGSLSGYATQSWVNSQGFMKSHTHQVIMPTGETSGITLASFNKDGVRVYQQTNDKGDGISYCAILSVSAGSERRYFQIIGGKGGTNLRWRTTNSDGTALGAVKTLLDSTNTYLSNGTITINGASIKPLISHQSLANYVTLNTAQTISGNKTFSGLVTTKAIQPDASGSHNLGTSGLQWNQIFCRRLYVTTGGSDSLTAAGLGTAVGLGWLELRSAGTPYIDFTGSNSTADYNVRLAYQNSQLEVNGANFSVANTIRSKAYIGMIFDYIGSTAKANTYGVMFYKRDTYFNIIRTKKGAPDTPTSDHGGSLMEINLATNAVTFAGVVAASNISTSSDARLKTRIADISLPIAEIAAAPLWRYRRKDTGVVDVGSTAQYWGAILPELTHTDEQGWMSLDYGKTALLASVSLARKADDHEARIKALEAENRALKQEIERIKAA